MTVVYLLLLALAAVCFLSATVGYAFRRNDRPWNLVALGLFFWTLVPLVQTAKALS